MKKDNELLNAVVSFIIIAVLFLIAAAIQSTETY